MSKLSVSFLCLAPVLTAAGCSLALKDYKDARTTIQQIQDMVPEGSDVAQLAAR